MNDSLEKLVNSHPMLWRGSSRFKQSVSNLSTGFETLNQILPGNGWPTKSVVEIVVDEWGIGELRLWLPLMAKLTGQNSKLLMIAPPHIPYAPRLARSGLDLKHVNIIENSISNRNLWWCCEKSLCVRACGLVMVWPSKPDPRGVRRLQLAAAAGNSVCVIFYRRQQPVTPAPLRLQLSPHPNGLRVTIKKARGSWSRKSVVINV